MFKIKFSMIVLFLFSFVFSQQDSMILVKKSEVPTNVLQKYEMQQKIENVGKWVGLGKEIGTAMKEGLGALTDETNKLSKTGVGKFTMFLIAYKVIGKDLIGYIFGGIFSIVITIMFIWFLLKKCKKEECIDEYNKFNYAVQCGKIALSVLIYVVCIGISCIIMFG